MSEPVPSRTAWVLPVLLAISTSVAVVLGYLYLARPNTGELGSVRVFLSDEDGKSGNSIRVVVSEAPMLQKDTVSPGPAFTGVVHYPAPYLTKPNLKLTSGQRRYAVAAETEMGFTWVASPLADDFREVATKDANALEKFLGGSLEFAVAQGKLKPGLIFEDFTWEAKGLRAPPSALPPKTFELNGKFQSVLGQEGVVNFEVPYALPPHVQLSGSYLSATVVADCTAKGFKWRNAAKERGSWVEGEVVWTAKGIRGGNEGK